MKQVFPRVVKTNFLKPVKINSREIVCETICESFSQLVPQVLNKLDHNTPPPFIFVKPEKNCETQVSPEHREFGIDHGLAGIPRPMEPARIHAIWQQPVCFDSKKQ